MIAVRRAGGSIREELLLAFGREAVAAGQRRRAFRARVTAADTKPKFLQRLRPGALKWENKNARGETFLVVRVHVTRIAAIADPVENARRIIHQPVPRLAVELHAD